MSRLLDGYRAASSHDHNHEVEANGHHRWPPGPGGPPPRDEPPAGMSLRFVPAGQPKPQIEPQEETEMTMNMPNPNPKPRSKGLPWLLTGVAVAVVLIGCASGGKPGPAATAPDPTLGASPAAATSSVAPAKPVVPTIDDGTWTVGVDIPAGTYKVGQPIDSGSCYWAITKTGSNGRDIIANDLPSGGRPSVTLKAGQDFETKRCGVWFKTN